jgi:hypothetical protein
VRPFDFVAVFYSVVLGVAVAQLMTGVGRLVEERRRVRNYWVHSVWILTVLLTDANNWWFASGAPSPARGARALPGMDALQAGSVR